MDHFVISPLGDTQFKADSYNRLAADDCMSLTFSLNPLVYGADILTQFRMAVMEFKSSNIFYVKDKLGLHFHPALYEVALTPELTSKINIHFHGYIKCDPAYFDYFRNQLRKLTWSSKVLGRQHTCKVIDQMTDALKEYPFKDTQTLLKFPDAKKMYSFRIKKPIVNI